MTCAIEPFPDAARKVLLDAAVAPMAELRTQVGPVAASLPPDALFVAAARAFAHPVRHIGNVETVTFHAVAGLDGAAILKGLGSLAGDRVAIRGAAWLLLFTPALLHKLGDAGRARWALRLAPAVFSDDGERGPFDVAAQERALVELARFGGAPAREWLRDVAGGRTPAPRNFMPGAALALPLRA